MSHATILVLCAEEPSAAELDAMPPGAVAVVLSPGLGGAWTELRRAREVIRFGLPAAPQSRWFRIAEGHGHHHTVASLALERMIFARRAGVVAVADAEWREAARRGAAVHAGQVRVVERPGTTPRAEFLRALAGGAP